MYVCMCVWMCVCVAKKRRRYTGIFTVCIYICVSGCIIYMYMYVE